MSEWIGTASNATASGATKEYPVANGVTVTSGDMVYLSGGYVTNASVAGATLLGLVQGGESNDPSQYQNTNGNAQAATGNAQGTVTVLVIVDPSSKFIMPVSGGTLSQTNLGGRYNLTGATGNQSVAIGAGGTQVECIATSVKGDTTRGIFIVNKHEYKVSA
jgi:hypothetical protein